MGAYKDYCFWGKAWTMHEKQSHCIGHSIAETEALLACVTRSRCSEHGHSRFSARSSVLEENDDQH